MDERLKDTTSPVPNKSPQSKIHPSEHAAPLHERLPLEVFDAIIHLCVGFTTPVRDLVTLQLVCRSWHDIIAGASFLWGTINAAEGSSAVRKALHLAKDTLIDLTYIQGRSKIYPAEFFELAREKINQWKSVVVVESSQWEDALADLRSKNPPSLETLHVGKSTYMRRGTEEIVLFGGDPAPGLKNVRFTNIPINRASLQLSGLKSLRLEGIPSVSANEVITLLTASPGLEILHLVSLEGAGRPTPTTSGLPNLASNSVVKLDSLIELKVFYLHLPFMSYLFSTVTFPQLRSLRVGGDFGKNPALQLGAIVGLNRLNPSINSIASGAEMYKVTLTSWGYYAITIGGLRIRILLMSDLSMDHFLETFTWLSGHLEQSLHNLPLHLKLKNLSQEPSNCLEWFTGHTNVTTLTLHSEPGHGPSLENSFQILSRPTSSPPSAPTWLLPHIEVLHGDCVWLHENLHIVDMIQGRNSVSRESGGVSIKGASPKRFREVWLACTGLNSTGPWPTMEFLANVLQAAGGANVYWKGKKWIRSSYAL